MAGASNESGVVDDVIFSDMSGYFFGNFFTGILYDDMLPLVGL